MGTKDGRPWLTPRLEGYEAALRLYGYARSDWEWLVDGALELHRLVHGVDKVPASELRRVRLADVCEG